MKLRALIPFCLFLIGVSPVISQYENLDFRNIDYVDYVRSVTFELNDAPLSFPIINLGAGMNTKLILKFDDIDNTGNSFIYDLIHCDRNWNPSTIDNIEYLDGFTDEEIEMMDFSFNTYMEYTQYTLELPNDDIKWNYSGNYLLVVYEDDSKVQPVLSRRFLVADSKLRLTTNNVIPSDPLKYDTHQEFDFEVNIKGLQIDDAMLSITAVVMQNNNWESAVYDLHPKFINKDNLVFDYGDAVVFPGIKEYRNFDTRTLISPGLNVHTVDFKSESTDVLLDLQQSRTYRTFHTRNDANGGFIMYTKDRPEQDLSAEYTNVIFALETPRIEENVFIVGGFNNYIPTEEHQMFYDEERQSYFGKILLKQGYYDYLFAVQKEDGLDLTTLEGSWHETENNYTILVYYSSYFDGYDQLIGVTSNDLSGNNR